MGGYVRRALTVGLVVSVCAVAPLASEGAADADAGGGTGQTLTDGEFQVVGEPSVEDFVNELLFEASTLVFSADGSIDGFGAVEFVDRTWLDAQWTGSATFDLSGAYDPSTNAVAGSFTVYQAIVMFNLIREESAEAPELSLWSDTEMEFTGSFTGAPSASGDLVLDFAGTKHYWGSHGSSNGTTEDAGDSQAWNNRAVFAGFVPDGVAGQADPGEPAGDTSPPATSAPTGRVDDQANGSGGQAQTGTGVAGQAESPPGAVSDDDEAAGENDGSAIPPTLIAAVAALLVILAAFGALKGWQRRTRPDRTEDGTEQLTPMLIELTYPAGRSPKVFTTGWVFGARCVANPGTVEELDVSDSVTWTGTGSFSPAVGKRSRPTFAGTGVNTITLSGSHAGQTATKSFQVEVVSPTGYASVNSTAKCDSDAHGCPACPHQVVGPVIEGSPTVVVRGAPAARQGDAGVHQSCCGSQTFTIATGDSDVLIGGRPAARIGDRTQHCGGVGEIVT